MKTVALVGRGGVKLRGTGRRCASAARPELDVILHLGAHRTGSTTLQCHARSQWRDLRAANVAFWGPSMTRDGRMAPLVKAADRVTPAIARAGRTASVDLKQRMARVEANALIISDENMLGSMFANVRERSLYGDAARRLARLRPAFARDCRRIGLAIRSYDRYWTSSLGFVLRKARRGTSAGELSSLAAQPRRWRHVITDVATIFPNAEVVVWPFEAMVDAPTAVLERLAPEAGLKMPSTASVKRHHPSRDCAGLRAELPTARARASVKGEGAWAPFSETDRARMRDAYATDIDWLRGGADGLARYLETPEFTSPEFIVGRPGLTRGTDHDQRQRRVG